MQASIKRIRHVALDLDGTVYTDETVFDCVAPFLESLDQLHVGHTFLTNNSLRSTCDYVDHLQALGIKAGQQEIYTSGDAAIECLREEWPKVRRLFVLGTPSLLRQFTTAGYTLCDDTAEDVPEMVVVGFDKGLTYSRLCRAAYWIAQGLPYVATHLDRVCPTKEQTVLVDCGAICAALEHATGCKPIAIAGKPSRRMLRGILRRHNLEPAQLAMVGDRLYTDMLMAKETGALGILVLSGETTAEQAAQSTTQPDLIVRDLDELRQLFKASWKTNDTEPLRPSCQPPASRAPVD